MLAWNKCKTAPPARRTIPVEQVINEQTLGRNSSNLTVQSDEPCLRKRSRWSRACVFSMLRAEKRTRVPYDFIIREGCIGAKRRADGGVRRVEVALIAPSLASQGI